MVHILLPPAVLIWDGRRLLYPNFIALVGHSYAASLTVSVLSSGTVPTTTSDLFELLNLKTDGHWSTQKRAAYTFIFIDPSFHKSTSFHICGVCAADYALILTRKTDFIHMCQNFLLTSFTTPNTLILSVSTPSKRLGGYIGFTD